MSRRFTIVFTTGIKAKAKSKVVRMGRAPERKPL